MIEKLNNNQISDIINESSAKQSDTARNSAKTDGDASLQITFGSLIEKAKEIPEEDTNAVEQARKLISSGRLESPENIRKAAENIVKLGI